MNNLITTDNFTRFNIDLNVMVRSELELPLVQTLYNALQTTLKQKECNRLNRSAFAETALIKLGYSKQQASLVTGLHDLPTVKNNEYILNILGDLS